MTTPTKSSLYANERLDDSNEDGCFVTPAHCDTPAPGGKGTPGLRMVPFEDDSEDWPLMPETKKRPFAATETETEAWKPAPPPPLIEEKLAKRARSIDKDDYIACPVPFFDSQRCEAPCACCGAPAAVSACMCRATEVCGRCAINDFIERTVYRIDCFHCKSVRPQYAALAEKAGQPRRSTMALVLANQDLRDVVETMPFMLRERLRTRLQKAFTLINK